MVRLLRQESRCFAIHKCTKVGALAADGRYNCNFRRAGGEESPIDATMRGFLAGAVRAAALDLAHAQDHDYDHQVVHLARAEDTLEPRLKHKDPGEALCVFQNGILLAHLLCSPS